MLLYYGFQGALTAQRRFRHIFDGGINGDSVQMHADNNQQKWENQEIG